MIDFIQNHKKLKTFFQSFLLQPTNKMPYNLRSQKTPKSELITIDVDVAVKKAKAEKAAEKAKAKKEAYNRYIIEKEKIVTEQKISEILSNKNETFYEMENNINKLLVDNVWTMSKKENKLIVFMQILNFGRKLIETCYAFRFTLSDDDVDVKGFTPENTKRILTKFIDVYIQKIIDLLPEIKEINTEYYLSATQYLVIAQDFKKMADKNEKMKAEILGIPVWS